MTASVVGVTGRMGAGKSTFCRELTAYAEVRQGGKLRYIAVDDVRRLIARKWPHETYATRELWELSEFRALVTEHLLRIIKESSSPVLIEWSMLLSDELLPGAIDVLFVLRCDEEALKARFSADDLSIEEREMRWKRQELEDAAVSKVSSAQDSISKISKIRTIDTSTVHVSSYCAYAYAEIFSTRRSP